VLAEALDDGDDERHRPEPLLQPIDPAHDGLDGASHDGADRSVSPVPTPTTPAAWWTTSTDPTWWTTSTVYQIYPRSFADSNGDGIGDLQGIIGRLDYLRHLGVDVLWLSPIYRSPQDDNGYDISDYRDIDPVFGTLADFDELLAAVHERGMRLVMDLVVNHTSDEHPWFVESRSSRDNPRRDWYWWRPARPGHVAGEPGAEPTNWASFFSGPVWDLDERTGEYYLHLFSRKQPDLNWENPEVRHAVYEMMRWWLDRGIDGFRMDVINMLSKHATLPDGELRPGALHGEGWPYFICGPRIHEFLAEMRAEVFDRYDRHVLTVGETPLTTVEQARLFTDSARREVDMLFQFEHVGVDHGVDKWRTVPVDWRRLKALFDRWQYGLADVGWNSLYWDNHDQPRAVSRFGDDSPAHRVRSAKALAIVLHLQRGTPYVYQGEELGMTNTPFGTIGEYRDIETLRYYDEAVAHGADPGEVLALIRPASRDNARTPMCWDAGRHAGFTSGEPWIGVNPDHTSINAEAAVADPDSVFHCYRRLIALRRELPVVALGAYQALTPDDPAIVSFTRTLDGDEVLVVANCSSAPAPVPAEVLATLDDADGWAGAEVLVASYDDARPGGDVDGRLRPWEAMALLRRSSSARPRGEMRSPTSRLSVRPSALSRRTRSLNSGRGRPTCAASSLDTTPGRSAIAASAAVVHGPSADRRSMASSLALSAAQPRSSRSVSSRSATRGSGPARWKSTR